MQYLVQYTEDFIYQVVPKVLRRKSCIKAKYLDRKYYEAKIIARNPSKKILNSLANNIRINVPQVIVERMSRLSSAANVTTKLQNEVHEEHSSKMTLSNIAKNRIDVPPIIFEANVTAQQHLESNIGRNPSENILDSLTKSPIHEVIIETPNTFYGKPKVTAHQQDEVYETKIIAGNSSKTVTSLVEKRINVSQVILQKLNESSSNLNVTEVQPQVEIYDLEQTNETSTKANIRIQHRDKDNSLVSEDLQISSINMLNEALNHNIIILSDLKVPCQKKGELRKRSQRKHHCFYCNKQLFKIYRHYIDVHKKEKEVKEIVVLPPKSRHRKILLDNLRKKGDYIFNSTIKNKSEPLLVCRQTLTKHKTLREKYVPCPHCMGYYSKLSIRHHIAKCLPSYDKIRRNIQVECRRLENNISQIASDDLKTNIFPFLNEDEVTNAIRYDEAVINYANYLSRKYTSEHHGQQIRSNIRTLGRLILALKEVNPNIKCLYEALDPKQVNVIIKGIDKVAGLDPTTHLYKAPATAMLLATELKKLCKLLEMEFIKRGDKEGQTRMENLSLVFNLEFNVTVNKKGLETQKINYRRKKTDLPKTEQIAKFRTYLEDKVKFYINKLEESFSKEDWTHLAEYTLVHLAVFNRKRPGETRRILIDDYKNYEIINDTEITDEFDSFSKEQIKKWARVRYTGKLGKNTALLIHRDLGFRAINLILKYREKAGVNIANRYVFGEPSQFRTQNTFQTCQLIRKFSLLSGIKNSELLRTRLLRQHLATETATSRVDTRLEGRVSDFMSHKREIHEYFYVRTQKRDDITQVSKLLEKFSSSGKHTSAFTSNCSSSFCSDDGSDEVEDVLTKAEIDYVMGKQRTRCPWSSKEKEVARSYFYDEINFGVEVTKHKAKKFFEANKILYKRRNPHLIIQWVKGEQKRIIIQEKKEQGHRLRWSTPEKEVLRNSTEIHSGEGTIPSIAECELLVQQHKEILGRRKPQSVKSFIYSNVKKQQRNS